MRIALQPAARLGEVARHYRDTIDTRVRLSDHAALLDPQVLRDLEAIFPDGTGQFWGATPGVTGTNIGKWAKLEPGDAVFFYGEKRLYLAGHIALPFRNETLAERLWTRDKNGLTWELMFALVNLRHIDVGIEEVRAALGWSDNAFIQGFTVVDDDRAENLADLVNLSTPNLPTTWSSTSGRKSSSRGSTSAPDGPTDGTRTASRRREHSALKRRLVELAGDMCGICGNTLPAEFLVGAHIKKREHCSDDERKDFDNIGMLACLLGCDSLFEHGYIAIDHGGTILVSNAVATAPDVAKFVADRLEGRTSTSWWNATREPYYAWHRSHTFIQSHHGAAPSIPTAPESTPANSN